MCIFFFFFFISLAINSFSTVLLSISEWLTYTPMVYVQLLYRCAGIYIAFLRINNDMKIKNAEYSQYTYCELFNHNHMHSKQRKYQRFKFIIDYHFFFILEFDFLSHTPKSMENIKNISIKMKYITTSIATARLIKNMLWRL